MLLTFDSFSPLSISLSRFFSLRISCMASSTPPHYSIAATSKPHQNPLHYPSSHKTLHNPVPETHFPPKVSNFHSPLTTPKKSHLSPDFCSKKSTRFHSKLHYNRPKSSLSSRHSPFAEQVLEKIQSLVENECHFENILVGFEKLLRGSEDYCFLLRELGNRGEFTKVVQCYEFAIKREKKLNERGKLVSSMISVMGRLGKIDLARNVFDNAVNEGYGNTVYTYSALISAYGRSGFYEKAIGVFDMMKNEGLKPNLVTYNAVIDACAKAGVNFKVVSEIFEEMLRNGVTPDRITFNSMLGVCKGGLWEEARGLFDEMSYWRIDQDVFTYNTLLDAICKGGKMDMAFDIMSEMTTKGVMPNVVTYSTVIDGFVKAGRLEDALVMFNEMKYMGIALDRVCYNALLSIYLKLGRFKDALYVCKDMESFGIRKDVVTYNALLGGFGKQGKYDEVKHFFEKMKVERVRPNILTFSTVIDVYSKGGLYREAMEVFREFKRAGLKADVVLYSGLIDALCKSGLVESAVLLLDEMTKEGIRPNVVTYNTIIDAFGRSSPSNYLVNASTSVDELEDKTSMMGSLNGVATNNLERGEHDKVMVLFEQLAAKRSYSSRKFNQNTRELLCILGVFHKMHEQEIKPNVVTFSAIIHACSRCNSLEDASMLLEELRLFDDRVYGVAHGLLTGYGDAVWHQALSLFDEAKQLDSSTTAAFYNALTDVLWHFGQKHGAQLVALEGKNRDVWENIWSISCLDLHLMSSGAAQAMVHAWLLNIRSIVLNGHELPKLLSILTGWGKHSKIVGDSVLKRSIEVLLSGLGAPFHLAETNLGRFMSQGVAVSAWLKKAATYKVLLLEDDRTHVETNKDDQRLYLQPLPLECTFCNISVT